MLEIEIKSLKRKVQANLINARRFKENGQLDAYEEALNFMKIRRKQLHEKIQMLKIKEN